MSCPSSIDTVEVKSDWIKAPVKINWTGSSAPRWKSSKKGRQWCNKKIKIKNIYIYTVRLIDL